MVTSLARRRLIEDARRYLRETDFVFGYFPQLVMARRPSELWSLFWCCVRRLDDLLDDSEVPRTGGKNMLGRLLASNFGAAMEIFLEESCDRVSPTLIRQLYESTKKELLDFSDGKAPPVGRYLELVDQKAVIPVRICARLNGLDDRDALVDQLVVSLGRGIQLLDDLLDFEDDRDRGRMFITREELSLLNLEEHDIETDLEAVSRLRGQWILSATAPAYDAVQQLADNHFCLASRSWIEAIWKLIADGKAIPLPRKILRHHSAFAGYLGISTLPFELAPVSEQFKYRLFHPAIVSFLRRCRVFDAGRLNRLRPAPGVCLEPLLEPLGIDARHALSIAESWGRRDSRRVIDLDRGPRLPQVHEELSRIALAVGIDGADDLLVRLMRESAAGLAAELLGGALEGWHDLILHDLDSGQNAVRSVLAPVDDGAAHLVTLAADCVSLAIGHGVALQTEFLDQVGNRDAGEPG